MNMYIIRILLILAISYGQYTQTKCDIPTRYKNYYYYTVYLTNPQKTPDNFYLVLTGNQHLLYGGQRHRRIVTEPLIRFEHYTESKTNSKIALVQYHDFIDAINSDQPAHNVRVRSGDRYITLSKIFVREFRNGIAGQTLDKIVHKKEQKGGS